VLPLIFQARAPCAAWGCQQPSNTRSNAAMWRKRQECSKGCLWCPFPPPISNPCGKLEKLASAAMGIENENKTSCALEKRSSSPYY